MVIVQAVALVCGANSYVEARAIDVRVWYVNWLAAIFGCAWIFRLGVCLRGLSGLFSRLRCRQLMRCLGMQWFIYFGGALVATSSVGAASGRCRLSCFCRSRDSDESGRAAAASERSEQCRGRSVSSGLVS